MPRSRVPCPAVVLVWSGADEMMSPNSVLLFLKPIVPTLATLLDTTDNSVCAALRPESEV